MYRMKGNGKKGFPSFRKWYKLDRNGLLSPKGTKTVSSFQNKKKTVQSFKENGLKNVYTNSVSLYLMQMKKGNKWKNYEILWNEKVMRFIMQDLCN